MPYCTQCGNQVGTSDQFCGKCGHKQGTEAKAGGTAGSKAKKVADYVSGISSRNASLLCYIPLVGWVVGIVVLASERFRNDPVVRFHAFQGLYIFVAWLLVEWVIQPMVYFSFGPLWDFPLRRAIPKLFELAVYAAWVWMIIKVAQDEQFKLPIIGDLAERSVSEQHL